MMAFLVFFALPVLCVGIGGSTELQHVKEHGILSVLAHHGTLREEPEFGSTLLAWTGSNLVPGFHRARRVGTSRHSLLPASAGPIGKCRSLAPDGSTA
jgi:hypothetical protein